MLASLWHLLEALGVVVAVSVAIVCMLAMLAWAFYPLDKGDRR